MLDFQVIDLLSKREIDKILFNISTPSCEYSFTNLYLWGPQRVTIQDGFLFVMTRHAGADSYFFPAGTGNQRQAILTLAQDAHARCIPLSIYAVSDLSKAFLADNFPECFRFFDVRSASDYIYSIDRLADLMGKKLQAKRNHIHRFEDNCPDWTVEEISRENIPDCRQMTELWYSLHKKQHPEASFSAESNAISRAFAHYEELGFDGILLRSEGRVLAFTMGNRIRKDTFDVNFEKAYGDIPGDYAMINREFARFLHAKYPELRFLNREDDMGLEGLRKAKMSYYPDTLLQKWVAVAHPQELL